MIIDIYAQLAVSRNYSGGPRYYEREPTVWIYKKEEQVIGP